MFPKLGCRKVRIQKKKTQPRSNILLLSMVVIAKNGPPKVSKELLNKPHGCCDKNCED